MLAEHTKFCNIPQYVESIKYLILFKTNQKAALEFFVSKVCESIFNALETKCEKRAFIIKLKIKTWSRTVF